MSNMQVFYQKIQAQTPEGANPHMSTLKKLNQLDLGRMQSVVTGMWWMEWGDSPTQVSVDH